MSFLEPEAKFEKKVVQKEPLIVQEHESITLTTSVTPETAAVRWFKDGTEIKASKKCVIKSEGASRTLTVNAAESSDSALYTCQTKDDKQEFRVQVKGEQCPGHGPTQQLHFPHDGGEIQTLPKTIPISRLVVPSLDAPPWTSKVLQLPNSQFLSFAGHLGIRKPVVGSSGVCSPPVSVSPYRMTVIQKYHVKGISLNFHISG